METMNAVSSPGGDRHVARGRPAATATRGVAPRARRLTERTIREVANGPAIT